MIQVVVMIQVLNFSQVGLQVIELWGNMFLYKSNKKNIKWNIKEHLILQKG